MDLKKHFSTPLKAEPLHVVQPETKPVAPELSGPFIAGNENEPPIYSVRKLVRSLSSEMAALEQPVEAETAPPLEPKEAVAVPAQNNNGSAHDGNVVAPQNGNATTAQNGNGVAAPADLKAAMMSYVGSNGSSEYQVFQAVGKLFDQTRAARERLDEMAAMFEPIEALGQTVAGAFGMLDAFRNQLCQLAESFEPLKAFQREVSRIAESCDAARPLEEQIAQLTEGFRINLETLIKQLEPAEALRMRILQLAEAFEPMATLHERLAGLSHVFVVPADSGASGDEADTDGDLSHGGPTGSVVTFDIVKSA